MRRTCDFIESLLLAIDIVWFAFYKQLFETHALLNTKTLESTSSLSGLVLIVITRVLVNKQRNPLAVHLADNIFCSVLFIPLWMQTILSNRVPILKYGRFKWSELGKQASIVRKRTRKIGAQNLRNIEIYLKIQITVLVKMLKLWVNMTRTQKLKSQMMNWSQSKQNQRVRSSLLERIKHPSGQNHPLPLQRPSDITHNISTHLPGAIGEARNVTGYLESFCLFLTMK